MEHSFRIAIWMFLLLGFLQAKPVTLSEVLLGRLINDFGLELLKTEVSCSENVTFASPASNMMGDCQDNFLTVMKNGLERAETECTDTMMRANDALGALDNVLTALKSSKLYPVQTSSNCTSQETGNWTQFLDGCNNVFQRLKNQQSLVKS